MVVHESKYPSLKTFSTHCVIAKNLINIADWSFFFKLQKEKTLIFDSVNDRCFVMDLDKNEIKPPKTICDMYRGMHEADGDGVYKMDLEEVCQETYATEIAEITSQEYG